MWTCSRGEGTELSAPRMGTGTAAAPFGTFPDRAREQWRRRRQRFPIPFRHRKQNSLTRDTIRFRRGTAVPGGFGPRTDGISCH